MFSKNNSSKAPQATQSFQTNESKSDFSSPNSRNNPLSIIADSAIIEGNLISTGELQVDGEIKGDIISDKITVGPTAKVIGNIYANDVRASGEITGSIHAKCVNFYNDANVSGDVIHCVLSIEAGATVSGTMKRISEEDFMGLLQNQKSKLGHTETATKPAKTTPRVNTPVPAAPVSDPVDKNVKPTLQ